jgi:hypothetical protein
MPLLCFVLDTSASMNQKTVQGQRLIDHAKTAIENFISKVMTHLIMSHCHDVIKCYPIKVTCRIYKKDPVLVEKRSLKFRGWDKNKYLGLGAWVGVRSVF